MPQIMLAQSNKAYQSGQSSSMNVESNLEFRIRFVKETVSLAQWGQKNFHFTIYHPPPPSLLRQNKLKYWQQVALRRICFNYV